MRRTAEQKSTRARWLSFSRRQMQTAKAITPSTRKAVTKEIQTEKEAEYNKPKKVVSGGGSRAMVRSGGRLRHSKGGGAGEGRPAMKTGGEGERMGGGREVPTFPHPTHNHNHHNHDEPTHTFGNWASRLVHVALIYWLKWSTYEHNKQNDLTCVIILWHFKLFQMRLVLIRYVVERVPSQTVSATTPVV